MRKIRISLDNLSLKRKIFIAFCLISLLPLLVIAFYFAYKYVPTYAYLILGINILLGWWIITQIFKSIFSIINKTQKHRDLVGKIPPTEDEVEILDEVFERMSVKIKKSFEELRDISKSTEKLNQQVAKKVSLLSTILQINDLVSKEIDIKEVLKFTIRRIKEILNFDIAFILLDSQRDSFFKEVIESKEPIDFEPISKSQPFLKPLIKEAQTIILDKGHSYREDFRIFAKSSLKVNSLVLIPIVIKKEVVGILGAGNSQPEFSFSNEELESLDIFAKHIALLLEHKQMDLKIKDLEIRDALTGLYNDKFIKERLEEEIQRAITHQRPCGFILIKVKDFRNYINKFGALSLEQALKNIARTIKENLDVTEKAGRIAEDKLGIVAPEKSKLQLEKRAYNLLSKIKDRLFQQKLKLDLNFSIAENPIDGASSGELIKKAEESLQ